MVYSYVSIKIPHAKGIRADFFYWVENWFQCVVDLGKRRGGLGEKQSWFPVKAGTVLETVRNGKVGV